MSQQLNAPLHKLAWIKRRARRLERFYGVARRIAVYDAWMDWTMFKGACIC
jgi:hypothetical protein